MSTSNISYTCDIASEPEEEIKIELLPKIIKNLILSIILIIISYFNYKFILKKYNKNINLCNFVSSNIIFNKYIHLSIIILFASLCIIYIMIYKKIQQYIYILFLVLTFFWIVALKKFIFSTPDLNLNFKILISLNLVFIFYFLINKLKKKINSEYKANVFLNNLFNNYELLIILNFLFYIFYTIFIIIK